MDLPGTGIYHPQTHPSQVRVVIFGATGYIGRYVVFEFVRRGYQVVAFARARSGVGSAKSADAVRADLEGATVVFGDATNPDDVATAFASPLSPAVAADAETPPPYIATIVVSCLASRTGGIADSALVDYGASANALRAGRTAGASHYILLSAVCVQKPELAFQREKLRLEDELLAEAERDEAFSYSIVRPTAFFKSLAGQIERVKKGAAFIVVGDGELCRCNALSERDLASFMVECASDEEKRNAVLPVGGPGEPVSPVQQADILFRLLGREPKIQRVPLAVFDVINGALEWGARVLPFLRDAAEFGRIGRYYAVEDMVGPEYGADTLEEFFAKAIKDGGMEGQDLGDAKVF